MSSNPPTLWATASRQWEIPPKPKPGRKPKKDTAPAQNDEQGRRVQNRAAQRAFRERKQSQLADLQARVQSYEQGEIERNVALQQVAKRLKEENEALRQENVLLKEKLVQLEHERDAALNERKRWRDESPASSISSGSRKKFKLDNDPGDAPFEHHYSSASPESSADSRFPSTPTFDPHTDAFVTFSHLGSEAFASMDCGMCSPDTPCVCRDVFAAQETKMNAIRSIVLDPSSPQEEPSILDNLPPYQPAVPLRLRPRTTPINTVFEVSPPQPTCSGDPSNCSACADDSFGKAFCERLSALPARAEPSSEPMVAAPVPSLPGTSTETMPTSDAWRRFKAHPNVDFSDLDMLADVVARRSKCSRPTLSESPPPIETAVEAGTSSQSPILLTDPHAHFRTQEIARSSLSPLPNVLHPPHGVREVHADAVREALHLLDSKFLS